MSQGGTATFEIYLPRAVLAPAAETKRVSRAKLPRGNGEWILVADDEQAIREMVSIGLTSQGYRVITAANGAEAIAAVEHENRELRLILLDADMPVLNGEATIPFLRDLAPAVPIVLMSGQLGAHPKSDTTARLIKPFQLEELLFTITKQFAGH